MLLPQLTIRTTVLALFVLLYLGKNIVQFYPQKIIEFDLIIG